LKKLFTLIAFSVLLLIPAGTQNAFATEKIAGFQSSQQVTYITPSGAIAVAEPLYTTQNDPVGYEVAPGGTLDGVAELLLTSGFGTFRCTGSLLESDPLGGDADTIILTAAHCLDHDLDGTNDVTSGTATFERAAGDETININVAWTMIFPGWNGDFIRGDDIAIIELVSPPSSDVNRYVYDTNPADDIGVDADQVGYGRTGFLATGDTLPSGTKHAIINDIDGTADAISLFFGQPAFVPGYGFVTDADNGLVANDACAFWGLCASGLGNGDDEGLSAGGDSGGPTFALGAFPVVMGVTSWGGTIFDAVQSDVDNSLNSSHGEFAVYTRVSQYAQWITDTLVDMGKFEPGPPTPSPTVAGEILPISTTALFVSGIFGSAIWMAPFVAGIAGTGYYLVRKQMNKEN